MRNCIVIQQEGEVLSPTVDCISQVLLTCKCTKHMFGLTFLTYMYYNIL